jgi:hypothetical protein
MSGGIIIFPTGQTASKDIRYFDVFESYIREEGITSLIIIYPVDMGRIVTNATERLGEITTIIAVPVADPFYGEKDLLSPLKIIMGHLNIIRPEKVHIVTSGGTSKIGTLAHRIGAISEKELGAEIFFVWASKKDGGRDFHINQMPKLYHEPSNSFRVDWDADENICVSGLHNDCPDAGNESSNGESSNDND